MVDSIDAVERHQPEGTSVLDRRIDLTRLSGETLAWVGVLILAAGLRLIERTTWPLSPGEARVATAALELVRGGDIPATGWTSPIATELTALMLFLFGTSDGVVRLVPLLAGVAALLLLLPLRAWLGHRTALAAGVVIALSPTLAVASRRVDAGGLLVAGTLLLTVMLLRHSVRPSLTTAILTGLAASLLLLSDPLGWIAVPLAAVAVGSMTGAPPARLRDLAPLALALLAGVTLLSTVLLTRPGGFAEFLSASLGALWRDHLTSIGQGWFLVPTVLVVDELFALVLAIYAAWTVVSGRAVLSVASARSARGVVAWAGLGLALSLVLGDKGPALYALAVVPLALLAGIGLNATIEKIDWATFWQGRVAAFLGGVFLTAAAALSTLGLLTGRIEDATTWALTLFIVVVLALAPLVAFTVWIAGRLTQRPAPLLALAGIAVLAALALHSTALLGATNVERPGEPLSFDQTSPGLTVLIGRIDRLSRDVTTFDQDTRDPTGGHGLAIMVDESIAQPFVWYFRDYPNLVVADPNTPLGTRAIPHLIIARPDHAATLIPPDAGYVQKTYPLALQRPQAFANPDWSTFASAVVDPDEWRRFAAFLVDRRVRAPAGPEMFELAMQPELATRVYGPEQP